MTTFGYNIPNCEQRKEHMKNIIKQFLIVAVLVKSFPIGATEYRLETIADELDHPWSLTFLPDGEFLVSFLDGTLRRIGSDGVVDAALKNLPKTYANSQGGYFDVILDRQFSQNSTIYLAFAHGTPEANATRVISATLGSDSLENITPIFTVKNLKDTPVHYGGKLLQLADNSLLLTTGDGFEYREAAQDPRSQLGKIVRFNPDGSIPDDNPFADGKEADPYVYTMGHRSPQGLAIDSKTGVIYMHEHGPQGGDELNIVSPGSNFGWPVTSYGINYSGAKISPFETRDGIVPPIHYWRPSIAPSGMVVYRGDQFPDWQGKVLIGALVDKEVRMLTLKEAKVVEEVALFSEVGQRVRELRVGPDDLLYFLTETKEHQGGALYRVLPVADD